MIEALEYIFKKNKELSKRFPKWKILSFIDRHQDRIVSIYKKDKIVGFSIYLKLTDETLYKVFCRDFEFKNFEAVDSALKENGRNIHFIRLVSDGIGIIREGLRNIIKNENPETISWFNKEINKLFFYDLRRGGING